MTKRQAVRRISKALDNDSPLSTMIVVETIVLTYLRDNWKPPKSEDLTEKVAKNLGYEIRD